PILFLFAQSALASEEHYYLLGGVVGHSVEAIRSGSGRRRRMQLPPLLLQRPGFQSCSQQNGLVMLAVEGDAAPGCLRWLASFHLSPIASVPKPGLGSCSTIGAPFMAVPAEQLVSGAVLSNQDGPPQSFVVLQQSAVIATNRLVSDLDLLPGLAVILPGF